MERSRGMPGETMQLLSPEPREDLSGLRTGAIVPVKQPRRDRPATGIDQDERRALARQTDAGDALRAVEAPRECCEADIAARVQARGSCSAQPGNGDRT